MENGGWRAGNIIVVLTINHNFWIVLTIVNAIQIKKGKKWLKEEEEDERDQMIKYKVGYITCWSNMGLLALLFFFMVRLESRCLIQYMR